MMYGGKGKLITAKQHLQDFGNTEKLFSIQYGTDECVSN